MTRPSSQFLVRYGRLAALVLATANFALVFVLMWHRVPYPFEIEWMEGAMVDHVQRFAAHKPLYVAPSMEFVPFLYPPGFYAVSAIVSEVVGEGFIGLRIVSAAASAGVLVLLSMFVRKETGEWYWGVVTAGLFAATYGIGGAWFDVGRADMLMLFMLVAAYFAMGFGERPWTWIAAGLLLAAAILTKQSATLMAAPALLWLLVGRWRAGLTVGVTAGLVTVVATLWLDQVHDGWYRFYVFELPAAFELQGRMLVEFWAGDLLPALGVALLLGLTYLIKPWKGGRTAFYACVATGLITGAWLSRGHEGGYINVLIPAFAALSLLAGLGLHSWSRMLTTTRDPGLRSLEVWPYLAVLVQFAMLVYYPAVHLPSRQSLQAGYELVEELRATDGAVWVPFHGYLAVAAGKPAHAHWMAISDVMRSNRPDLRAAMEKAVHDAIREQRFSAIVLSSRPFPNFPPLSDSYRLKRAAVTDATALWPLTGVPRRPEQVLVPITRALAPGPQP